MLAEIIQFKSVGGSGNKSKFYSRKNEEKITFWECLLPFISVFVFSNNHHLLPSPPPPPPPPPPLSSSSSSSSSSSFLVLPPPPLLLLDLRGRNKVGTQEDCILINFIICVFQHVLLDYKIKENLMFRAMLHRGARWEMCIIVV